jgi:large subunit ribosomal protein L24
VSALTFSLREHPAQRIDLSGLTPDKLRDLDQKDIAALPLWIGNRQYATCDLFDISGADAQTLVFANACKWLDQIGAGMSGGGYRKAKHGVRKMHVRRGDRVRVIRGNFAGMEGTVLRAMPSENRVVIEGVNLRKRHARPSEANPEGGILTFEAPIHASNVMLIDPSSDEPTRSRTRILENGIKERVSARSGNPIPKAES